MLLTHLIDHFPEADVLGFDIETAKHPDDPNTKAALSPWDGHITVISISDGENVAVMDVRNGDGQGASSELKTAIRIWLESCVWRKRDGTPRKIVVHNYQFDMPFCAQYYGAEYPPDAWCTMIGERLLTAGLPHPTRPQQPLPVNLKDTLARRLGLEISKEKEVRLNFLLDNQWDEAMIEYAEKDSALLVPLYEAQRREILRLKLDTVTGIEMSALPVFAEMFRRGIAVNVEGLKPFLEESAAKAEAAQAQLEELLTQHVFWARKRDNRIAEAKVTAWNTRFKDAEMAYATDWDENHDDETWRYDQMLQWDGTPIDPAKDGTPREVTLDEVKTWFDATFDKADGAMKGRKRFIKRMMYLWRRRPENAAPNVTVVEVTAPINVRSTPQKKAAIESYIKAFNEAEGTDIEPPKNLLKHTLIPMTLDQHPRFVAELLDPLLEFSKYDKRRQMLEMTIAEARDEEVAGQPVKVVHGKWKQYGADTGRPSCDKPNLANVPNKGGFRENYEARPGHLLIIADQSQIEQRILAERSGDEKLIDVFVTDRDIHRMTASEVYGVPEADVDDDLRKKAKKLVFGVAYGLTAMGYRRNLAGDKIIISKEESEETMATQKARFPQATAYINKAGWDGINKGYSVTSLGRRRFFEDVSKLPGWMQGAVRREAANHTIQGTNADVTKAAMIFASRWLAPLSGTVLMNVYDEIVAEVPEEHAWEAKAIMIDAMHAAMEMVLKRVPAKCDCVISPNWSEDDGKKWEAAHPPLPDVA